MNGGKGGTGQDGGDGAASLDGSRCSIPVFNIFFLIPDYDLNIEHRKLQNISKYLLRVATLNIPIMPIMGAILQLVVRVVRAA